MKKLDSCRFGNIMVLCKKKKLLQKRERKKITLPKRITLHYKQRFQNRMKFKVQSNKAKTHVHEKGRVCLRSKYANTTILSTLSVP